MVRDAEQFAGEDKRRKDAIEAKNEAETLLYSSEKSLSEYKVRAESSRRVCARQIGMLLIHRAGSVLISPMTPNGCSSGPHLITCIDCDLRHDFQSQVISHLASKAVLGLTHKLPEEPLERRSLWETEPSARWNRLQDGNCGWTS